VSERVLYEWTTESGRRLSILDESDEFGKGEVGIGVDGEVDSSFGWGLALSREIARLAARVAELEAENAKLRKCVEAADAFFLVEDAMSNATEEGVGKDLWIESQEHRNSYDAARAEVDR